MGEKYKVEIIQRHARGSCLDLRQGDWMDLCRGPHVPSTRYIRAFKLTSVAGAYWRGDEQTRCSRGFTGPLREQGSARRASQDVELARARDHRKLGREMGLFMFDPISPGRRSTCPKG